MSTIEEIEKMTPMERSAFDTVIVDAANKKLPSSSEGRKKIVDTAKQAAREAKAEVKRETRGMKSGGKVKSASARADGCAVKGKTRGKIM